MRAGMQFALLMAFYALLSGQIQSTKLMLYGAVGCVGVVALSARLRILDDEGLPVAHWIRTARYLPWLLWQIVLANWDVFRRVWFPSGISPRMVEIEHGLKNPFAIATFANSITLTPGTVTAHVGVNRVQVHALTEEAARELESGEMLRRIKRIDDPRAEPDNADGDAGDSP